MWWWRGGLSSSIKHLLFGAAVGLSLDYGAGIGFVERERTPGSVQGQKRVKSSSWGSIRRFDDSPHLYCHAVARVIVVGTYDPEFGRNRRMFGLLETLGHEVARCHVDLWRGPRYQITRRSLAALLAAAVPAYARLVYRFLRTARGDVVLVLYPGWFDVIVLAPLARIRRMPILLDVYISVSDTVVSDRGLARPESLFGRLLVRIDRASMRRARRVLADTPAHAAFYADLGDIPRDRIGVVWVGADDDVFRPRPEIEPACNRVLFYGTFIHLHGIDVIVHAAKLLDDDDVEIRIVGTGQEAERVDALIRALQPRNVRRIESMPLDQLAAEIAGATVCLGIFGSSAKAGRVVANKVFECVAVGRPVITADTEGVRAFFGPDEVAMVPAGDPEALAAEIRRLLADPQGREAMAQAAHARYVDQYSGRQLARAFDAQLMATVASARR